jgi:serine/threonine protein kinase
MISLYHRLLDVHFTDDNQHYLVFEFVDYDLRTLIDKKHFITDNLPNEHLIKFVLYQILRALYECHSRRIFHRDIKPANILLNNQNIVKLADFGLAKPVGQPYYR